MLFSPVRLELPHTDSRVIVVAASAGGVPALRRLLGGLPADFPASVLVVLHRRPERPSHLGRLLTRWTPLAVREPWDGERLRSGTIYTCAADRHTRLARSGRFSVAEAPNAARPRPRADPIFRSVAEYGGERAIAVILTGYGQDGSTGAAEIHRCGGLVLVQDPSTCEERGMPDAVLRSCGADFVLPPEGIGHALASLVVAPRISAALFGLAAARWRYRIGSGALALR